MGQGQAGKKLQSAGRLRETHRSDRQHHYPNVLVLIDDMTVAGGGGPIARQRGNTVTEESKA